MVGVPVNAVETDTAGVIAVGALASVPAVTVGALRAPAAIVEAIVKTVPAAFTEAENPSPGVAAVWELM
jgi:hypothetical protein